MDARRSKKVDKGKALKALKDSDEEDDDDDGQSGSGSEADAPKERESREKSVPRGNQIESDEDGD